MSNLRTLQKQWQAAFLLSPVVDQGKQEINHDIAHQLYYGQTQASYHAEWPRDFCRFVSESKGMEIGFIAKTIAEFLLFIGTEISAGTLLNHLGSHPRNKNKLIKKVNQVLKTIAHQQRNLSEYYVFEECDGEWFYLLKLIENKGNTSRQLDFYEELDLPKLYNLPIYLPNGYENSPGIKEMFDSIENSGDHFFITGKAGTGKSTFIHYLCSRSKKNIIKTAFTGIAAMNIGGETLHSFFYLPFKPLLPGDEDIKTFYEDSYKRKLIEKMDVLLIDEVSMLRSDVLEAIDYSLRKNTGKMDLPFGGKQVILVGDLFQLPPVVEADQALREFFTQEYASEFFFDAPVFKCNTFRFINLTTAHRQAADKDFTDLLDEVRACNIREASINTINQRCDPWYEPDEKEFIIYLTTTNALAKSRNTFELNRLPTSAFEFYAETTGDFTDDKFPVDPILKIKKHAQVIFIKNDKVKRWINGTIGKVEFVSDNFIEVRLQDGSSHQVSKEIWENRQYNWNRNERKITSKVTGTFLQFPLKLAWAITIHKCQGLTLENAIIDFGRGAFSSGQVYTALSRCRTLQGIVLKRELRVSDLILDLRITDFYNRITGV